MATATTDHAAAAPSSSDALPASVAALVPTLSLARVKGACGVVGVLGGCGEYAGAPYFAAMASIRVGADMTHVFCSRAAAPVIKSYSPELIVHGVVRESADVKKDPPRSLGDEQPSTTAAFADAEDVLRRVPSHTGPHATASAMCTSILKDFTSRRISPLAAPRSHRSRRASTPFNAASDAFRRRPDVPFATTDRPSRSWTPRLSSLVVGPGLGRDRSMQLTAKLVVYHAMKSNLPIVFDADGLYMLTKEPELVRGYSRATLTPNVNELRRVLYTGSHTTAFAM
jgi:ATP-dependent NAD(P)H-hydrate dehydratase